MATRVLTAHVPSELAERIDAAAERLDRPRAWIVKQALTAWLTEEERHQATLDALAQADAGETIDHEAVLAWARQRAAERKSRGPG